MTDHEDSQPNVPPCRAQETASVRGSRLSFPGDVPDVPGAGPVNTSTFIDSHGRETPTTLRNVKRTRPAEAYPGEAKKMVDRWTTLTLAAVQRARDATSGPRLVSALEEAEHAIGEALRWSKP